MKENNAIAVGDMVVAINNCSYTNVILSKGHAYKVVEVRDGLIKPHGIDAYIPCEYFVRVDNTIFTFTIITFDIRDGKVVGTDNVASFNWHDCPDGIGGIFRASSSFAWLHYPSIEDGVIEYRPGEDGACATAWVGAKKIGEVWRAMNPYRYEI